jgi:multidrug resistance efflux pump
MTSSAIRPATIARRLFRYTWILGVALLLVSVAGTGWMLNTQAADKAPKNGATVGSSDQITVVAAYGDVVGGMRQLYPILALPNHVKEVKIHENETVAKDAVLLTMDDMLARTTLARAEADLENAQAQLEQAKQAPAGHDFKIKGQEQAIAAKKDELSTAQNRLKRAQRLRAKELGVDQEDLDAADLLVKSLEHAVAVEELKLEGLKLVDPNLDVTRAEKQVKDKQAVRDQAQYMLDQCVLKAPVDGTAVRVTVNAGDLLGPQPHQAAILFCPNTPRILRGEVYQEFAGRVSVGQSATIQDDTTSSGSWHGKVTRLSDVYTQRRSIVHQDQPFQLNDVRIRECIIELDPGQPPISINQRMRVTLGNQ